jgi:hypothetical protein
MVKNQKFRLFATVVERYKRINELPRECPIVCSQRAQIPARPSNEMAGGPVECGAAGH